MVLLSESQQKFYIKIKTYFQEELGFQPFRQMPTKIILHEIAESKKMYQASYTNCIIAKQCLISFFPKPLHTSPLVEYWVLYRFVKGQSDFFSSYIKNQMNTYFDLRKSFLIQGIHTISDLAFRMVLAVPLIFPKGEESYYFRLYVKRFANLQEFFTENDVTFSDVIMDDIWIARNYDISLTEDQRRLVIEIERLYHEHKKLLTKEEIWDYLQDRTEMLLKSTTLPSWLQDKEKFEGIWSELAKRGASIRCYPYITDTLGTLFRVFFQTSDTLAPRNHLLLNQYLKTMKFIDLRFSRSQFSNLWIMRGYIISPNKLMIFLVN